MKIIPLAAESLGVRSSAVFVETPDVKVLIDPGVSLAPLRFGLAPHPREILRMNELWNTIKEYAAKADVLIITHFHYDHFDPTEPLLFQDKVLLMKHPKETINASQRQRARDLAQGVRSLPRDIEPADGREFVFSTTVIRFSPPVPHGPTTKVGWVIEVSIRAGDRCFLYTSDIQGACLPEHLSFIRAENPDLLYLDGPLTYLLGQGFSMSDPRTSVQNISAVIETLGVETVILDHHLLRDGFWEGKMHDVLSVAEKRNKRVVSVAAYLGRHEEMLEAHRRDLFREHPDMPDEPLQRNSRFQLCRELKK